MSLENDLELYVEAIIKDYDPRKVDRKKIIRDAILGTHELSPLEVNILDTPFVQRLRGIHQTALAFLTYPSATHNRFEHSLGVSIMASRIGKALGKKIDPISLKEVRIAGLLHDIGHGPFSHVSEDIIREFAEVNKALRADSRFSKEKPHEIISYKILQTNAFKQLFERLLKDYKASNIKLKNICPMIVGQMPNRFEQYKAEIINGPFDADKMDYLIRDAYFTGIKMSIDFDRVLATQLIDNRPGKTQRIICDIGGVHILEQIVFSKMLLFPSVYHHHKVRAAVCAIKSIFEIIRDNELEINDLRFDRVSDFLLVDDNFFLTEKGKPTKVAEQIKKIKRRELLKRALVISRKTLKEEDNIEKILKLRDRPKFLREIARAITEDKRLSCKCEYHDVWIDLPDNPRFPEPSQCIVKVTDKDYQNLDAFFPVAEWSSSFATNKWRGYVFGPAKFQKTLDEVSRDVFKSLFNVELNEHATILAKHASYAS